MHETQTVPTKHVGPDLRATGRCTAHCHRLSNIKDSTGKTFYSSESKKKSKILIIRKGKVQTFREIIEEKRLQSESVKIAV